MLPTFFKHGIALCIIFLLINVSSFAQNCTINNGTLGAGGEREITVGQNCIRNGNYTIDNTTFRTNPATLTINGDLTITGNLTVEGNLNLNGSLIIDGSLTIAYGGSLQINSGAELEVGSDINNNGGSIFALFYTTEGSVSGTVTVGGDFNNNFNGNITIGDGGIIDVTGAYNNNDGSSTTVQDGGTLRANPINEDAVEVVSTGTDSDCTDTCCGDEATCQVLLPVELVSFKASLDAKGLVTLLWETAQEINNEGFYVQKSPAAYSKPEWKDIAFIQGNGNIEYAVAYEYIDNDFTEDSYYRLKQVDFDGKYEYHESIFAQYPLSTKVSIYPNPFSDHLNVKLPEGIHKACIYDLEGLELYSSFLEGAALQEELKLFTEALSPGSYILSIQTGDNLVTQRVLKY